MAEEGGGREGEKVGNLMIFKGLILFSLFSPTILTLAKRV